MIIKMDVLHEQVSAVKLVTATRSVMSGGSEGDRRSLPSYWTTSIHHDASFVIDTLGHSELIKPTRARAVGFKR